MTARSHRMMCIALVAGMAACTDNTPVCVPRTAVSCFCATGEPGQQLCRPDGQRYADCECLPDAGVDAVGTNENDTPAEDRIELGRYTALQPVPIPGPR